MSTSNAEQLAYEVAPPKAPAFPLNQWYVAALSSELKDKPVGRTLLNKPIVLFRMGDGQVAALEDRCCHRALPLSDGTLEAAGVRCGYHGLLFNEAGKCVEIPGQDKIPSKAKVPAYHVKERDHIVWIWFGVDATTDPDCEPPEYKVHSSGRYVFDGDVYHYDAPYQLIHDNLMDLSHLGYVHLKTIGGNASVHMNAEMRVESEGNMVRVVRYMPNSLPPPTYTAAYPFKGNVDRWQEIEFHVSHLLIWTGAVDVNTDAVDDPERGGFHMRGFHGVTPETDTTSHYFWTMATNPVSDPEAIKAKVIEQTILTFDEDKVIIEAQYKNMCRFGRKPLIDIHVDVGANRARRIIEQLKAS
ncbi:aromatic ring-hydroxylating dioxygenase subunit alpha [Pseudomonas tolaasii]|uniref:aromatic ring-hydroxylating dioxygenase subunit alpha n=1 Tax=Pseudomonas tolaasii TaxID=29442 RepID=UPI001C5E9F0D|nr:aromatic ring-hydroxylating dioxygenase subunit alpha [Pseudomonas tolaasii]MBW4793173.1 aromatic ring-hydroxylating dioxygenase subunit alpha [Pseudomonas tolaasii]